MSSNFSSLRASREASFKKLNEEVQKKAQNGADERFWKLTVDPKTKLGYAVIRFLPNAKNEELPWVNYYSHNFKVGGSWFIENCPTTLGQVSCPVCKDNNRLWNSGIEDDKKTASARKRKMSYVSNILVVNDTAHPENNGKVFLFRYGVKIYEKIQEYINPKFPDQAPGNPFDMWGGADFKLKSVPQGDFANYDKSEFAAVSELFPGDDDAKEALWETEYPLQPFVVASQFKSYEDLDTRFFKVLNGDGKPTKTAADAVRNELPTTADAEAAAETVAKAPRVARTKKAPVAPVASTDDDDLNEFFKEVLDEE